jgi:hypothetical protein
VVSQLKRISAWPLTSGGIANDHMATPARPPERMIAPTLRSEGDDPTGVSAFFTTS